MTCNISNITWTVLCNMLHETCCFNSIIANFCNINSNVININIDIWGCQETRWKKACINIYIYVYVYVCMYVCIYISRRNVSLGTFRFTVHIFYHSTRQFRTFQAMKATNWLVLRCPAASIVGLIIVSFLKCITSYYSYCKWQRNSETPKAK